MSTRGAVSTISISIVSFGLAWLCFWYGEQKSAQAQFSEISTRVTKVETLQPELVNRLDRMEIKLDQLLKNQ